MPRFNLTGACSRLPCPGHSNDGGAPGRNVMMHQSAIASTLASALGLAMISTAIHAAEINFVSSTAMREPLEELIPAFEKASGHKVVVAFYPAATLVVKGRGGVRGDGVIPPPENIETWTKDGRLAPASRIDFAHS